MPKIRSQHGSGSVKLPQKTDKSLENVEKILQFVEEDYLFELELSCWLHVKKFQG